MQEAKKAYQRRYMRIRNEATKRGIQVKGVDINTLAHYVGLPSPLNVSKWLEIEALPSIVSKPILPSKPLFRLPIKPVSKPVYHPLDSLKRRNIPDLSLDEIKEQYSREFHLNFTSPLKKLETTPIIAPTEEAPTEEAPTEETPTEEAPTEETPIIETKPVQNFFVYTILIIIVIITLLIILSNKVKAQTKNINTSPNIKNTSPIIDISNLLKPSSYTTLYT